MTIERSESHDGLSVDCCVHPARLGAEWVLNSLFGYFQSYSSWLQRACLELQIVRDALLLDTGTDGSWTAVPRPLVRRNVIFWEDMQARRIVGMHLRAFCLGHLFQIRNLFPCSRSCRSRCLGRLSGPAIRSAFDLSVSSGVRSRGLHFPPLWIKAQSSNAFAHLQFDGGTNFSSRLKQSAVQQDRQYEGKGLPKA